MDRSSSKNGLGIIRDEGTRTLNLPSGKAGGANGVNRILVKKETTISRERGIGPLEVAGGDGLFKKLSDKRVGTG